MAYNTPKSQLVVKSPLINMRATGNYNLFTTQGSFIATGLYFNAVTLTGTIGVPVINIGYTGPDYSDLVNGTNNVASSSNSYAVATNGISPFVPVPAATTLVLQVNVADLTATANTQYAYIIGFYV